jgi:hypothetical protein
MNPIYYNSCYYNLPLSFIMTTYFNCNLTNCNLTNCNTPCANIQPCRDFPIAFPCFYIFTLVPTKLLNFTFTITDVNNPTSIIANGTAVQIQNTLSITFLDSQNQCIGNGIIQFVDYNIERQGIFQIQGSISSILPQTYIVYPSLSCCIKPATILPCLQKCNNFC